MQQFRFSDSTAFTCFRCGQPKKSKLITVYRGQWSKRLCNGCYGRLLSLYEIKRGTGEEDEKAEALANALLSSIAVDERRRAENLFRASHRRAEYLSAEAVRFVATAEHVASQLEADPQLEWSPAVIGLCKATEAEIVYRLLRPLSLKSSGQDLSADRNDKDLGKVAAFCIDPTRKPPELGTFGHFLQTAIHSRERRSTSPLLRAFLVLASEWSGSHWLLDVQGLHTALNVLTSDFRNRAAHIDELGKADYIRCRELVIGAEGILWKLALSTERPR